VEGESGIGTSERKGGFAGQKGALPYPVQGTVVSGFGLEHHEKFGTTIRHNGIDIATEQLSPVVAVYEGQVIYCDWVKGYGKVIIIDHGDKYYTLTAHLGEIAKQVGERVEGGEVIGSAGYAPGDGQKGIVYFEIRHRGNAVNPQSWLLQTLANSTKRGD
jgi:septal ring factor EnvC (AmiA/AmiB activator)